MTNLQGLLVALFSMYGFLGAVRAYRECRHRGNSYGWTPQYYVYGAFVWGDVLVFGLFWFMVGAGALFMRDWLFFLLVQSVFWLVRSLGETIYWFNEQFAYKNKNHPPELPGFHFVNNDSIWFIYQIIAQLITVISILATIVLTPLWLSSIGILD